MNRVCCFTGHRMISKQECARIQINLEAELRMLIQRGVNNFLCGGALGFDTLCAQAVLRMRREYPKIRLVLVLPCPDQARKWLPQQQQMYFWILSQADELIYTSPFYSEGCMSQRNRFLVEQSQFCICYLKRERSGTGVTVRYAAERGLEIIRLV